MAKDTRRSQAARVTDRAQPPSIVGPTRKKTAQRDARMRDLVQGKPVTSVKDVGVPGAPKSEVRIPVEKMSEAKADIYKKAGLVGADAKAPRAPKPSVFNRPLRGARPTGGGQHDRSNAGPEVPTEEDVRKQTLSKEMAVLRHGAKTELKAPGAVLGEPTATKTGATQVAAHHASQALQAATNTSLNPRQKRNLVEGHRSEVHRVVGQMKSEERRIAGGMQIPCSTPGCKNMSVSLSAGSCAGEGGRCNVSPSISSADLAKPRADI